MNSNIILEYVEYVPKEIAPGILYVSKRYNVAVHLCPCGCMSKVVTPLGACEWEFYDDDGEPTLSPSIGNWQIPCKSHYWIECGKIEWSYQWSEEQIEEGYKDEKSRREKYLIDRYSPRRTNFWVRLLNRIFKKRQE